MTLCDPTPRLEIDSEARSVHALDVVPPLYSFYLYMTSVCNLRCRHCWVAPSFNPGQLSPKEYLDIDLLRRAVAEAKPFGLNSAKLTGGEPVLHPQFIDVVDLLTGEGLSLNMETNATLIDAALARYLKRNTNLAFISVSLDGPNPEVHDPFRGVEGSFENALRGLRHLVEAGYRPQLIMALHRGNIGYVEQVVELATEVGAGSVKFNPVVPSGRGLVLQERGEILDVEEVLQVARFVRGDLQRRTPIRLVLSTPLALYTVGELVHRGPDGSCRVRHILGILSSGEMALCGIGRTVPELCFGNLRDVAVAEVWLNHPLLQRLRHELDAPYRGTCSQCIHSPRCLSHCVAQNYQQEGQFTAPFWLCAEARERGLFPTSRLR